MFLFLLTHPSSCPSYTPKIITDLLNSNLVSLSFTPNPPPPKQRHVEAQRAAKSRKKPAGPDPSQRSLSSFFQATKSLAGAGGGAGAGHYNEPGSVSKPPAPAQAAGGGGNRPQPRPAAQGTPAKPLTKKQQMAALEKDRSQMRVDRWFGGGGAGAGTSSECASRAIF